MKNFGKVVAITLGVIAAIALFLFAITLITAWM